MAGGYCDAVAIGSTWYGPTLSPPAGVHQKNRALWYAWLKKVTGGVGRRGTSRNTSMDAIGVYRGDTRVHSGPIGCELGAHIHIYSIAARRPDGVGARRGKRYIERIGPKEGQIIGAALAAAVGDVPICSVVDNFTFKQSPDEFIIKVAELVSARGEISGQSLSVLVRYVFANELAYVDPHLIFGLEGLFQIVPRRALIIEDCEGRLG